MKIGIILPGINAKMNEIQAAIGLRNLHLVDEEIKKRRKLTNLYKDQIKDIKRIIKLFARSRSFSKIKIEVRKNYLIGNSNAIFVNFCLL